MELNEFLSRIANLRVDQAINGPKPYKPVLLAAVIVLIHKRKIMSNRIVLDGALKSAFNQLLYGLFPRCPPARDARYPFRHLRSDGVWKLVPRAETERLFEHELRIGAKAQRILRHVAWAEMDAAVFDALANSFEARFCALSVLCSHYFPKERCWELLSLIGEPADVSAVGSERNVVTEKAFEEYLQTNWKKTPFYRNGIELACREKEGVPGRQVLTPVNSIDLLGYQAREKTFWVFELKRGSPPDKVVGQVSRYLGWVKEVRGGPSNNRAVGVVLAQRADAKLRYAIKANPLLSLWTWNENFELTEVM